MPSVPDIILSIRSLAIAIANGPYFFAISRVDGVRTASTRSSYCRCPHRYLKPTIRNCLRATLRLRENKHCSVLRIGTTHVGGDTRLILPGIVQASRPGLYGNRQKESTPPAGDPRWGRYDGPSRSKHGYRLKEISARLGEIPMQPTGGHSDPFGGDTNVTDRRLFRPDWGRYQHHRPKVISALLGEIPAHA